METAALAKLPNTNNHTEEGTFSIQGFEHAQRVAKMLASSKELVPEIYRGKVENCLIALEMATRIGASPIMVMQNLYIIQGKPSWSSQFIIASLNSCGRFSPLRFIKSGEGDLYGYEAWAEDKKGEKLIGPKVDWAMVKAEGWLSKAGSKWKTMPELMFRYRAAAFFGRLYAPDILMGMQTAEETIDVTPVIVEPEVKVNKENERLVILMNEASSVEKLEELKPHLTTDEQLQLFNEKLKAFVS